MHKHALVGALVALALSACGSDNAEGAPPGAAAPGAAPSLPAPAAAAVTVASCTTVSPAGTLCIEFNQAQYASLGAAGASAICTSQLSSAVQPNVPCSPFDQLGSCTLPGHVLYGYKAAGALESHYRQLCAGTAGGRFLAGGGIAEPGPDAVHPGADATLTVGQAVLYVCTDRCTSTRLARVVDVLPDGRVTVEDQGDRDTVTRDRIWVGSYTIVPNGLGNSEADDFPTITDAPLPVGTEVWAKDTWWYRGRVVEDTGGERLRIDFYGYITEPQEITRRNVRLHR